MTRKDSESNTRAKERCNEDHPLSLNEWLTQEKKKWNQREKHHTAINGDKSHASTKSVIHNSLFELVVP